MTEDRPASDASSPAAPRLPLLSSLNETVRGRLGVLLIVGGLLLAIATQFAITTESGPDNKGYGFLFAVLLVVGGAFLLPKGEDAPLSLPPRIEWALAGGILVLGAVLRVCDVWDFPPGLWYDEVFYGVDALNILENDHYVVWSTTINGRPTLFMYILAGIFKVYGVSEMTMRALPIAIGVVTIGAFYFLARELLGQVPALAATFLLAVSRWQITFSRIVWEASMMPLMVILSVFFLIKALRTGRWYYYVACGASVGAGLYTYLAFRMMPIALVVLVLYIAWREWPLVRQGALNLVLAAGVAFLVFLPLGHYGYTHQDEFLHRAAQVNLCDQANFECSRVAGSAVLGVGGVVLAAAAFEHRRRLSPAWTGALAVGGAVLIVGALVLLREAGDLDPLIGRENGEEGNVQKVAKMYNVFGDRNGRHNIPGEPMLDEISAALLVVGAGVSAWGWWNWRRGLMLLLAAVLAVPSVFTLTSENPSAIRALGTVPGVFLLTGLAFVPLVNQGARWAGRWWTVGPFLAALLVTATAINSYDFFERQVNEVAVFREFHPEFTLAANVASEASDDHTVIMSPSFARDPVMLLLAEGVPIVPFAAGANVPYREEPEKDVLFILDPKDSDSLSVLQFYYPDGVTKELLDPGGALVYSTFELSRATVTASLGLQNRIFAGGDVSGEPEETQALALPSIDWAAEDAPVDGPFTMVWEGTIFLDQFAPQSFEAISPGNVRLELDGSLLGEEQGEVTVRTEALAVGPHSLRVTLGVDEPEGVSALRWLVPGGAEFEVVPTQALFNQDVGDRGFIARYFPSGATGDPSLIARQVVLGPVALLQPPYTAELIAKMSTPEGGTYGFALEANQETLIFVDGNLVLERGPSAGGRAELQLVLDEGEHDILIRYTDPTGQAEWRFEWRPPGSTEYSQPPLELFTVPPGGIDALPVDPVLSTIEVDATWGAEGRTLEGVESPRGIAFGPDGALYFLDGNGDVRVFDTEGRALRDWNTGVAEPSDIAVAPDGSVYVLGAPDRVLRFQPDGTPDGELTGEFQAARGISVSQNGNVYVAHASLSGILVLEPEGALISTIRPADAPDGTRYLQPTDVAITPEGVIFTVTAEEASIWRLTPFGGYVLHWAFTPSVSNAGSHLSYSNDRLIATDPEGGRVLAYDPDGRLVASGQLPQSADGQRARPVGVAANGDVVWTADLLTGRVFKLNVRTPDEQTP